MKFPLFAALTMMAVVLSGCTSDGAAFSEPAPTWKAGYVWAYETTVEGAWEGSFNGEAENGTYDDAYPEVYEVLNTTTQLKGEPVYLLAYGAHGWGNQLLAQRHRDLGTLWVDWGCLDGGCPGGFDTPMEHDQAPSAYRFPLTGSSGWSEVIVEEELEGELRLQYSSRVTGLEVVDTPLGPIETIVIQRTMRIQNLQEVLGILRDEMESEGVRVLELDADYTIRGTDHYAPVYQNTVMSTMIEDSHFDMVLEEEGERFEIRETSQDTTTSVLTGARLQPGPEKGPQEILSVLAEGLLNDPTGQAVEAADYVLSIEALADEVNVAEDEPLRFQAVIDGDLPTDHTLSWWAFDLIGTTVASGDGTNFEAVPTVPGVYSVLVQSSAGGQPVQSAVVTGIGHYRTTLTSACGPAEVGGLDIPTGCQAHAIPVRPGIATLDIQATTTSPLDAANQATIRLTDSMGNTADASDQGDAKHLQMSQQLAAYAVSGSDWTLDWHQTLGLLESQVTFDVDLTYGAGADQVLIASSVGGQSGVVELPGWLRGDVSFL